MGITIKQVICSRSFANVLILLLGSLSLGIAIAFPSPTMAAITASFSFTTAEASLFNAITSLTAVFGPFYTSLFLQTRGRRFTIQATSVLCTISWIIILVIDPRSQAKYAILHRAVLGVAIGGFTAVIPLYIMELSPVEMRSIYGSMHQFGITVGIFLMNLLGALGFNWYQLSLFSFSLPLFLTVLAFYVPESPTFLASANNNSNVIVGKELPRESVFGKRYFPSLFIGIMMMVFQQFSGINAVLSNLKSIVQSSAGPTFAASSQCFSCLLCISIIEMIGRKKTWMISLFGSAISMFVLALDSKFMFGPFVAALAAFAFLFFFCFGLGPIPWFLPPEMFPDRLRGTATSILSSLNWIFSFTIVFIYPLMIQNIGNTMTLSIFAIILALGGFYGLKYIGEAKQQILHQTSEVNDEVPSFADVMVDVSNDV